MERRDKSAKWQRESRKQMEDETIPRKWPLTCKIILVTENDIATMGYEPNDFISEEGHVPCIKSPPQGYLSQAGR